MSEQASTHDGSATYDLVIVGGTAGGLSVAISSLRSGRRLVRVVESGHSVVFPDLVGPDELDVGYGEHVSGIDAEDDVVIVSTNKQVYRARACLVADRRPRTDWRPPLQVFSSPRIHIDSAPDLVTDSDVLIVGYTDHAVELTAQMAAAGARVVLAAGGMDPGRLSPAGEYVLRQLERDRRATLLYRSTPEQIADTDGYPMVYFGDRRTPDLQFDHVIFATQRETLGPEDVGLTKTGLESGRVWFLGEPDEQTVAPTAPGWRIGLEIAAACFPEVDLEERPPGIEKRSRHTGVIGELREEHYNATITYFEPTHSDLWVLRVRPDQGGSSFVPGQYASLGLGYWEERVDGAEDPGLEKRWDKLIRRSYSISSRIFDDTGYLADERRLDELEFYIVLVPPTSDNIPGLTPRLALKHPGDRLYLGPKVAGRYTLGPVTDPASTVLFLATGTGEAPHNAMIVELLRKGHYGQIVSAVSVRKWADLGYLERHEALTERYANYHYLPLPTREPERPKRYIQDLLRDGDLEGIGVELDPRRSHVFLCGNPAMIGIPEQVDSSVVYPKPQGVVELLTDRGFALDRRKEPGNIHVEEYW
ncbi:MAG: NAD(P)-binding domain-containing protein [Acidimicrobiia bacterium]